LYDIPLNILFAILFIVFATFIPVNSKIDKVQGVSSMSRENCHFQGVSNGLEKIF